MVDQGVDGVTRGVTSRDGLSHPVTGASGSGQGGDAAPDRRTGAAALVAWAVWIVSRLPTPGEVAGLGRLRSAMPEVNPDYWTAYGWETVRERPVRPLPWEIDLAVETLVVVGGLGQMDRALVIGQALGISAARVGRAAGDRRSDQALRRQRTQALGRVADGLAQALGEGPAWRAMAAAWAARPNQKSCPVAKLGVAL